MPLYEHIPPLVRRHAEDAAFYWSQHANTAFSPLVGFGRFAHFDRLVEGHLDGLRIADRQSINADGSGGDAGWKFVWANLKRWKGADEAFVAYVLALEQAQTGNHERMTTLWPMLEKHADTMLTGAVSAFGWVEDAVAQPWLEAWVARNDFPLLQEVALRGYAIRREMPAQADLAALLASPHAGVRQAVCKLASMLRLSGLTQEVTALRKDLELNVRAAALVALFHLGEMAKDETLLRDLWEALKATNELHAQSRGLAKKIAGRKAETLARIVGHATPCGHPALGAALRTLPERKAILVLAHQGDPAAIQVLVALMGKKPYGKHARIAAWALTHITGVDWDSAGLSLPPPPVDEGEDERTTPLQDPDVGLPWPNVPAVQAWWSANAARFTPGASYLLGGSAGDSEHLFAILAEGPQLARWSAALHLAHLDTAQPLFETRAPALLQRLWLD